MAAIFDHACAGSVARDIPQPAAKGSTEQVRSFYLRHSGESRNPGFEKASAVRPILDASFHWKPLLCFQYFRHPWRVLA
jgi:hypothetical protein